MANAVAATTTGTNASGKKVGLEKQFKSNSIILKYNLYYNTDEGEILLCITNLFLTFFRHIPVPHADIQQPAGMVCLNIMIPFT